MDEQEKDFLKELLAHRMEIHYQRICDAKPFQQRKEELEYLKQIDDSYKKVLDSLSEEHQRVIAEYVERVSDAATEETENYYTSGFKDGLKLMGALIKYYIR